jgi:Thioredoxin
MLGIGSTADRVQHEFLARSNAEHTPEAKQPVFIPSWRDHLSTGFTIGSSDAPVQLIEFADFECPFCAAFHETITTFASAEVFTFLGCRILRIVLRSSPVFFVFFAIQVR